MTHTSFSRSFIPSARGIALCFPRHLFCTFQSWAGRGFSVQLACDPRGTLTRIHEAKLKFNKAPKAADKVKSFFGF